MNPDVILAVLKSVFGFAFSTSKRAKITMIVLLFISLTVTATYITYKYSSMQAELSEKELHLQLAYKANEDLGVQLSQATEEIQKQREEFDNAILNRKKLEGKLIAVKQEKDDALAVFDKECGRIERLMDKKASLIVRYANRATGRVYDEFKAETN